MRNQTESGTERLQYDTNGELIGRLVKASGQSHLMLEEGFIFVQHQTTSRIRVWDTKKDRVVEFAK